jgi:sugar lactone lactonase YvrE
MPDGNVAVITRCRNNGCKGQPMDPILILDRNTGKLIRSFGAGYYDGPHGGTVDKDGNVWTADQNNMLVRQWSKEGKLLMTIGTENVSDPTGKPNILYQPTDVAVDADGFVYITNSHAKQGANAFVAKYDKTGKFVKILGQGPKGGNLPGQLDEPHSITLDIRGRLFIGDRSNNRIQIWDREGNFIAEWRQFSRPSSIYIAADDRMWVFDSESFGVDNPGWMKGWRQGNALTGVVSYYAQDIESRDYVHSGPEFGGVDADGNVYACVVRRQQLERHEPPQKIPTRNAAWGPYVANPAAMPLAGVPYVMPGGRGRGAAE